MIQDVPGTSIALSRGFVCMFRSRRGRSTGWITACHPLLVLLEGIPFASGLGDSVWVLYGLARSLKPEVCVEIGSSRGKSACYVGLALEENGKGKL